MNYRGTLGYDQIRSGGAFVKTSSYTAVDADAWSLLVFQGSATMTLTLPGSPPSNLWMVRLLNLASTAVSIAPTAPAQLNGFPTTISLPQGWGLSIFTDGTNYYAEGYLVPFSALGAPLTEIPQGPINGTNVTFTVTKNINSSPKPILEVSGVVQDPLNTTPDFTYSGNTITYAVAPEVGAKHVIWYWYGGTSQQTSTDARRFNTSNAAWVSDVVNWGGNSLYNLTGNLSIGMWVQLSSSSSGCLMARAEAPLLGGGQSNAAFGLGLVGSSGAWNVRYWHGYGTAMGIEHNDFSTAIPNSTWTYLGISRDTTAKTVSLYTGNGTSVTLIGTFSYTNNPSGGTDSAEALTVGNMAYNTSTLRVYNLLGAFTDSGGNVIQVVQLGDSATCTVPAGATQLQLGVADGHNGDNTGSWTISVNATNYTVPGTAQAWSNASGANALYNAYDGTGTAPVVISGMTAGSTVAVAYVSGTVIPGVGLGSYDANGAILTRGPDIGSTGLALPENFVSMFQSLDGTVQQHYVSSAVWSSTDHTNAMLGSAPSTGLVLACAMGNTPETDYSGNGGSGAVTGTSLVTGH